MITKESFIAIIDAIREQELRDTIIAKHIDAIVPESTPPLFVTSMITPIVTALDAEFGDDTESVAWWLWDAPRSNAVATIDNVEHVINCAGDLYDYMVINKQLRDGGK